MNRLLLGDLGHRVARLEHRARVGVEVEVALLGARVAPGDQEHLLPGGDEVLDEAASGGDVEDVEAVDRRRHEQQRDLEHLLGARPIVDQLEDVGPQHDRPG